MKFWRNILKGGLTFFIAIIGLYYLQEQTISSWFGEDSDGYSSQQIYVLDRETKTVILEKNAQQKTYPASLAKMMTTLVALEHIDDLDAVAPVDTASYQRMVELNASMAGFYGQETTTYRDLLYGTMLPSGGEAANSLAINVAGNVADFVVLMNDKADEIGLEQTNFTSPEGLHDEKQTTTAYDMALLLDYALQNGHFRAIFMSPQFTTSSTMDHPEGVQLHSTVFTKLPFEEIVDFEILGGKSGTTYEAGQCWAILGTKNGKEYISIVMGAELENISKPNYSQIADTIKIFQEIE